VAALSARLPLMLKLGQLLGLAAAQALGLGADAGLGGAHVGAQAQHVCGHAGGQVGRGSRQAVAVAQALVQAGGWLAQQHGDLELGLAQAGLLRRNGRAQLLHAQPGLLGLQAAGQPGLGAPAHQGLGVLLGGQVLAGDAQALVAAAQLQVGQAHLGADAHLHGRQVGGAGADVGLARPHRGRLAAKEVRLPAGVQARVVERAAHLLAAAARDAGAAAQLGRAQRRLLRPQRAHLGQAGACLLDAGVGLQCLVDQRTQQRVVELAPPGGQRRQVEGGRSLAGGGAPPRGQGCRDGVGRCRFCGGTELGAGRQAEQAGRQQGGQAVA